MAVGNRLRSTARDARASLATEGSNFATNPASCFVGVVTAPEGWVGATWKAAATTASMTKCGSRRTGPLRLLLVGWRKSVLLASDLCLVPRGRLVQLEAAVRGLLGDTRPQHLHR